MEVGNEHKGQGFIMVSVKGYAELFLCIRQTYFWNFSQENEYESYVIVQATE